MFRVSLYAVALIALCAVCAGFPGAAAAQEVEKEESIQVHVTTEEGSDEAIVKIEMSEDDHAWLGVGVNDLTKDERAKLDVPKEYIVHVNTVHDGSPADDAGIAVHDVIISFDGEKARDTNELIEMVQELEPFTNVEIRIFRDGSEIEKNATMGVRPRKYVWKSADMDDLTIDLKGLEGLAALGELGDLFVPRFDVGYAWGGKGRLGVYVDDLSEGLAEYFEVPGGSGVLVEDIVEGGAAQEAGIRAGDVIIEIDGAPVADTDELSEAIRKMEGGVPTPVRVVRGGKELVVEATVEKADERVVRMPGRGVYIFGDDESEAYIDAYKLEAEARKEAMEEQLEELREALKELQEDLEELREDSE